MSNLNFDKGTGKKGGWKSFYMALALCIVAVGGVATATFLSLMSAPEIPAESDSQATSVTTASKKDQPVVQNPTNIPDDRTTAAPTTAPSTATTAASPAASLFVLPISNEVIREYSDGLPVYMETMADWRAHNGVDFKGSENQNVKAVADGEIQAIGEDIMFGKTITISHGHGIISKYCGVSAADIKAGDTVKAGDVIGILSGVPCESGDGAHLHFEITVNGEYVNPIEAIGQDVKLPNG